jgi:streptogramin lyase
VLYVDVTTAAGKLRLRSIAGVEGTAGGVQPQTLTAVTVNELTTVATSYAVAQFSGTTGISGPSPGLENAAATAFNLVDPADGTAGAVLTNEDNGAKNETLATLDTLANLVSLCASPSSPKCDRLLRLTTPPGGAAPADTVRAMVNLARNPTLSAAGLYGLARTTTVYQPRLGSPPAAWILVLHYTDTNLFAPGRLAIDSKGNVWTNNNWLPGTTKASPYVTVLDPVGKPTFGSPISGGGTKGSAWGVGIADGGTVWVSNFAAETTVSAFSATGTPLSPDTGWTDGGFDHPNGVAVDQRGNVWITNQFGVASPQGQGSVVVYPGGDRTKAFTVTGGGLNHPFAVQIDGFGRAWLTNQGQGGSDLLGTRAAVLAGKFGGSVTVIDPDFKPSSFSPVMNPSFRAPIGLAIDSQGNAWIANGSGSTVTEIAPDGKVIGDYRVGRGTFPFGIAVDGSDRVWVFGFARPSVRLLCGADTSACPPGSVTGTELSPQRGFRSKAFQHLTAGQIDQSGNVWVNNNWTTIKPPTGGVGMDQIVGIATPVCAPLTPLPQQPSAASDTPCPQQTAASLPASLEKGSGGTPAWVWIAIGAGAAAVLAVAALVLRRRRNRA